MRAKSGALALFLILILPFSARAESVIDEMRLGVLAQGWGAQGADKEQGVGINVEALFKSPRVLSIVGAPRPHVGASVATDSDATSQIYAGLEWKVDIGRVFAAASVAGAVHNGETDFDPVADAPRLTNTVFLGCRALFRLGADIGYRLTDRVRASVHVDHSSTAGLCSVNEGLDNFGLRFGYHF